MIARLERMDLYSVGKNNCDNSFTPLHRKYDKKCKSTDICKHLFKKKVITHICVTHSLVTFGSYIVKALNLQITS